MTQERKVKLFLTKKGETKMIEDTYVKLRGEEATIAGLKAAGYAKLFNDEKYVKEKEEVTCVIPTVDCIDEMLISEQRSFVYKLYVTEKPE